MAKTKQIDRVIITPTIKGTSIGRGVTKTSSMNKTRRRSYKKYRGQG